jgi:hypothetical protein
MDRSAGSDALVRGLAETSAQFEAVGRRLSAEQLTAAPKPGAWSPNEILWHIRATADVSGEHIRRILDEDQPRWRHVSPRARMKKSRYDQLPFAESFAALAEQRDELVALLASVPPEAWQRAALVFVPYYGRDLRVTLHERVWALVDHEEGHCAQMKTVAATLSQPA